MIMKYRVLRFADIERKFVNIKPLSNFTKFVINIRRGKYVFVTVVAVQSNTKRTQKAK